MLPLPLLPLPLLNPPILTLQQPNRLFKLRIDHLSPGPRNSPRLEGDVEQIEDMWVDGIYTQGLWSERMAEE